MKKICAVDKLDEYEEAAIAQQECDYYILIEGEWERLKSVDNFEYINTKNDRQIRFNFLLYSFDSVFDNVTENIKMRICISDDQCVEKVIKKKRKKIYKEIKEIDFEVISVTKNSEELLNQTVIGKINGIKDIDNDKL